MTPADLAALGARVKPLVFRALGKGLWQSGQYRILEEYRNMAPTLEEELTRPGPRVTYAWKHETWLIRDYRVVATLDAAKAAAEAHHVAAVLAMRPRP